MEKRRRINKHLPTEIVEEILYNLPVKSLLRFKCVSKSWNSLISSKDFIEHHLKKSITDDTDLTDLTNHRLIITFQYAGTYFRGHGSIPLRKQPVLTPSYFHDSLGGFSIMGSCNGLLLVTTTTTADLSYLWNPSTRKYKEIHPSFGIDGDDQLGQNEVIFGFPITHHYDYFYGLGYDESNNDYKVVCIRISSRRGNPIPTIMYSSKTNSWKKIENLPDRIYGPPSGRFVNGRLHWLSYPSLGGTGACNGIICLDLVEEKYEILVPPECSSNNANFLVPNFFLVPKLEELGGFLSLIYFKSWADIDVWVMTEYGVRESWSKIWTLSDFVDAPVVCADGHAMPFCWRKNGDIAVVFGEEIVVYNGHNVLSRSRIDMLDDKLMCVVYVESLVSPFGSGSDDEQC